MLPISLFLDILAYVVVPTKLAMENQLIRRLSQKMAYLNSPTPWPEKHVVKDGKDERLDTHPGNQDNRFIYVSVNL